MNRSKVDFITSLLSDKKLAASHKERLYPLILSEIKKAGDVDEHIWQELQEIKKIIQKDQVSHNVESEDDNSHNPLQTSETLKLFKTGNKLKWITHIYPNSEQDKFDYETITESAIAEFNSISRSLPKKLAALISVFLKAPKDPNKKSIWYLGKSYKTWWSEEIKNWCNEHPGLHPDTDGVLSKEIITPFKKSIEIRTGEDFKEAIMYRLSFDNLNQLKLNFSGLKKSTRFFTGVDDLMTGIACLFKPIIKRKEVSEIVHFRTAIQEVKDRYATVLTITHVGSNCDHEFLTKEFINGDLLTAKEKFHSLCDWNIVANFLNGTFHIPILGGSKALRKDELATGFTHQLIFY